MLIPGDNESLENAPARCGTLIPRLGSALVLLLFLSSLLSHEATAAVANATPEEFIAATLHKLTSYIEWPPNAMPADTPFVIGILGEEAISEAFSAIIKRGDVEGKIKGRPLKTKKCRRADDTKDCQIIFISSSEKEHLRQLLEALQDSRALIVADTEGFAERGVMMNLVLVPVPGKQTGIVQFQVNRGAAERAGFKIPAAVLRLAAKIVP